VGGECQAKPDFGDLQGGGEAPDEARHSLDRFIQATAGSTATPDLKPCMGMACHAHTLAKSPKITARELISRKGAKVAKVSDDFLQVERLNRKPAYRNQFQH